MEPRENAPCPSAGRGGTVFKHNLSKGEARALRFSKHRLSQAGCPFLSFLNTELQVTVRLCGHALSRSRPHTQTPSQVHRPATQTC